MSEKNTFADVAAQLGGAIDMANALSSASMRAATRAARRANDAPADSDAQRAMMAHVAHCDLACEIIGARDAVVAMMAQKGGAR